MIRKIVEINEELCNGCGMCAAACHEGAIAMVNGKAKLIKDDYCDGLGDCLPACPANAISIIEREAKEYDEIAVKKRMEEGKQHMSASVPMCPGSKAQMLHKDNQGEKADVSKKQESQLKQWPVQIKLMPLTAPYYESADLLIAADCTAYAYGNFHADFMKNCVTVIGCPKLDEGSYVEKLTEIIKRNSIKSVRVVRMEVPCCGGLEHAVQTAVRNSGREIPFQVDVIMCDGRIG